jgi:hypothetical protein
MVDGALLQTSLSEFLFSAGMNWFRNGLEIVEVHEIGNNPMHS